MKVIVASHNEGKIKEFHSILEPLGFEVLKASDFNVDVSMIEETGTTFAENALIKAKAVYEIIKLPVVSDDSGLNLDAFPELLGVYSARFMENEPYHIKNKTILKKYETESNRKANFESCVVYYDGHAHSFSGIVEGEIVDKIKGEGGFGYDPIFKPSGYSQTFGEMSVIDKDKISHRARALNKFVEFIKEESNER
ncbi:RdgB/HAM1 family non-canonical purine NTP pyrophosphatase [Erysipelothrix urinaevulpis]|uniref:RdgB/HAM1 family non-canonical purine NTP pyrophosphatase n=1 Tax=Erysipelothrix urinaevulpis TaxID=2683717 RepID=UPI0013567DDE|nr:RdgB/HAM1 family non-canonical purine NTP pyrophosphatase [Erysipelothrix urinaevulpis]